MTPIGIRQNDIEKKLPPCEKQNDIIEYNGWRPKTQVPGDHPYRRRI